MINLIYNIIFEYHSWRILTFFLGDMLKGMNLILTGTESIFLPMKTALNSCISSVLG